MKADLTSDGIPLLVDSFYAKVQKDDLLGPVFNVFAQVNWDAHLPKMYNFWRTILFADGDYKGSPFDKHVPLPVTKEHFDRWLALFSENMDELFEGEMVEHTKQRAALIGWTFSSKLGLTE